MYSPKMGSSLARVKPYILNIGICCFSALHAALKRNSKDLLAGNRDNVPEWKTRHVYQRTVVSVS